MYQDLALDRSQSSSGGSLGLSLSSRHSLSTLDDRLLHRDRSGLAVQLEVET